MPIRACVTLVPETAQIGMIRLDFGSPGISGPDGLAGLQATGPILFAIFCR